MCGRLSPKDIGLGKLASIVELFTAGEVELATDRETSVVVPAFLSRFFLLEYMAKYELVGEQEENELFQSSLRMGGHARKMRVGTGVVKCSSTLFYSQEVDLGCPFPTNG